MHLGRDRVIAAHEVRGELIVDPGPASALETLIAGLDGRAAGAPAHPHPPRPRRAPPACSRAASPTCASTCSEVGAPHLVDPSRLLRERRAPLRRREHGAALGRGRAGPGGRTSSRLEGGEEVEGFRVEHVPGHAGHHVFWLDLDEGDAYVGDMAGVRIPPGDSPSRRRRRRRSTSRPGSTRSSGSRRCGPQRLRLTHFGVAEDVGAQLERARESLLRRRPRPPSDGDRERFLELLEARIDAGADPETAARLRQASPPEQLWLGLERYWRKRREPSRPPTHTR